MKIVLYWFILLVSILFLFSSCAEKDEEYQATTASSTSSSGSLPYFTGTPPTTAVQGTAYSFTPTIVNPANDTLSFSMLNQPSWMSVDNTSGVISSTHGAFEVSTTSTNLLYMLTGTRHTFAQAPFSVTVSAPEITATSISYGHSGTHGCALDNSSGKVKCWGRGDSGQLGIGTEADMGDGSGEMGTNLPYVELGTGRTATVISNANYHTCALLDDATVKCWGKGGNGRLGTGNENDIGDAANEMGDNLAAVDLGTGRTATAISGGNGHTCVILDNASVKCWGENNQGEMGKGNTDEIGEEPNEMGDNLTVVDLGTGRTATAISAGTDFTCALLDNASVKCWGKGSNGRLGTGNTNTIGDGSNEMGDNLAVVDLGTGRTATAISAGTDHACVILDNASVKCWGDGNNGKLGLGSTSDLGDGSNEMGDNLAAVDLGTGRTATAISASYRHTCALLDDASVKCWGDGSQGQLGHGSTSDLGDGSNEMGDNLAVVDLGTGRTATAIETSNYSSCALLDNSEVKCWGYGNYGVLGTGSYSNIGRVANEMGDNLTAVDL